MINWPGLRTGMWALAAALLAALMIFAGFQVEELVPCTLDWRCSDPNLLLGDSGLVFLAVTVPVTVNAIILAVMSMKSKLQPGFGTFALLLSILPLVAYLQLGIAFFSV